MTLYILKHNGTTFFKCWNTSQSRIQNIARKKIQGNKNICIKQILREFITQRLKIQSILKKILLEEQVPHRNSNLLEGISVGMINIRLNVKYAFVLKINCIPSKLKQLVISKHLFKKWKKQATD